jgi:hypothetical protein
MRRFAPRNSLSLTLVLLGDLCDLSGSIRFLVFQVAVDDSVG